MKTQKKTSEETITSLDGTRTITVEEFDQIFDDASDEIDEFVDFSDMKLVEPKPQRVNVDCPTWMVRDLDHEATRIGITRQALIKVWLAERLEAQQSAKKSK